MKNENIRFPIINLARSWLKLKYESPIIIDLIIRKLKEKLDRINYDVRKILLIGYGTLGQAIYKVLKERYFVSVFDTAPEKSRISSHDFKTKLAEFDLIIGCTGTTSLSFADFIYLKKPVVLASVSSSDREFEAFKLRSSQPQKNCHADIVVEGITLLNSGFPIPFDEDYDSIDVDDFQLTRALILVSVYQAITTNSKFNGFHTLRDDLQQIILSELMHL